MYLHQRLYKEVFNTNTRYIGYVEIQIVKLEANKLSRICHKGLIFIVLNMK